MFPLSPPLGFNMPPPKDCWACAAKAGENHAKNCLNLHNLRAAMFPKVLDGNGREWQDNLIDKLKKENEQLKKENPNFYYGKDQMTTEPLACLSCRAPIDCPVDHMEHHITCGCGYKNIVRWVDEKPSQAVPDILMKE